MNFNSPWVSLLPLLVFNVVFLATVLTFRRIYRKRGSTREVEERHSSKFLNKWMREYWLWLTEPIVRFLVSLRLTPNIITVIGVIIGILSGYFFAEGRFGLGGWLMIFGASFDIFDGRVARRTNQVTASGAYFDSVMDRVSEGAIFAGLVYFYRNDWFMGIVITALIGSFMVSYAKAKGDAVGINYSGGSMQRPERIVYMGVGAVMCPLFAWPFLSSHPDLIRILYLFPLGFVALMTWVTSCHRILTTMRLLDCGKKSIADKRLSPKPSPVVPFRPITKIASSQGR